MWRNRRDARKRDALFTHIPEHAISLEQCERRIELYHLAFVHDDHLVVVYDALSPTAQSPTPKVNIF
jgi:hypothetical protein